MENIQNYKLCALLVGAIIILLISRKLFISLLLIFIGGFLILTFGRNIYARDIKAVEFGMALGLLLIILGIIYLFI